MSSLTHVVGVDFGGTRTKYGLVHLPGDRLLASITRPTEAASLPEFIAALTDAAATLAEMGGISAGELDAVGIGVPGFIDGDFISQVWESMAYVEGEHFRPAVETAVGLPVRLDNDARVVALGEYFYGGHGRPRRLLSLTLGTGVGFALVLDGRFHEPVPLSHMGGHMLVREGAAPCYCGQSGCLESLVNAQNLVDTYAALRAQVRGETPPDLLDAKEILQAAAGGQPPAVAAAHRLMADLSAALNSYIYQYAPEVIVLGGGLSLGLQPFQQTLLSRLTASPYAGYQVRLRFSELGEAAGIYGATALWKQASHPAQSAESDG